MQKKLKSKKIIFVISIIFIIFFVFKKEKIINTKNRTQNKIKIEKEKNNLSKNIQEKKAKNKSKSDILFENDKLLNNKEIENRIKNYFHNKYPDKTKDLEIIFKNLDHIKGKILINDEKIIFLAFRIDDYWRLIFEGKISEINKKCFELKKYYFPKTIIEECYPNN